MAKNNNAKPSAKTPPAKPAAKKQSEQTKLQNLVRSNAHFQFLENGKVRCILTEHEFLPTLENYQQYLKSKSYRKGVEAQFNLKDYEEYLIVHKDSPHFLFCRLTGVKLPKKKTAIEKHVQSKRFKNRLQEVLEGNGEEEEEVLQNGEEEEVEQEEEDQAQQ